MYRFTSGPQILSCSPPCLSLHQDHTILLTVALQYVLKSGNIKSFNSVLFQDCFGSPSSFASPCKMWGSVCQFPQKGLLASKQEWPYLSQSTLESVMPSVLPCSFGHVSQLWHSVGGNHRGACISGGEMTGARLDPDHDLMDTNVRWRQGGLGQSGRTLSLTLQTTHLCPQVLLSSF